MEHQSRDNKKHIVTKDVVGLLPGEVVITKKTHHHKGCGWLAYRRGSEYKKKTSLKKDVIGLLLGEVVSTKKTHIVAKRMWLAY